MKILMVCLGNICRSPLAEGILKDKLQKRGIKAIVDSAGTGGYHIGKQPDKRSIEIALEHEIDIRNQRARKFRNTDIKDYDYIFVMDSMNYQDIQNYAVTDEEKKKVKLILNESFPTSKRSVPDPYYGGLNGFRDVFKMLEDASEKIIENYFKT